MPVDPPAWVQDAVFYQVFPDRFARSGRVPAPGPLQAWDAPPTFHGIKGGDLLGLVDRLGSLRELGITALYLNPVFASAANHRYHTYDYLSVDPLLGGDAALRELVDGAHALGMRVVLDGVFNHCGRGFWPFHHVLENGPDSPYRDWFILDPGVLDGHRRLDPYPLHDHGGHELDPRAGRGYEAWWGLPALPKLNIDNPVVREYLYGVGEHWLRFGVDGWRLDVPEEITEPSFWPEFRRRCRAVRPDAYLVGEIWNEAPDWLRGDRFDALMNYPLGAAILGFAGVESLDEGVVHAHHVYRATVSRHDGGEFGREVERLMTVYEPAVVAAQLNLIGSHDAPRALSVLGGDVAALRVAFALQLSLPGAPCIYYGDEIGMAGGIDPDNRRAYPAEPDAGDQALRAFVGRLIAARHAHVALRRGDVRTVGADGPGVVLVREAEGQRALIAANAGHKPVTVACGVPGQPEAETPWQPLEGLVDDGVTMGAVSAADQAFEVTLPPQAIGIFLGGRKDLAMAG